MDMSCFSRIPADQTVLVPYTEANFQDWGGGDFHDVMDDVDALIAKGISDPDHLAMRGWSLGGFMTAWTVTHTNRNENTRSIRTLAFSVGTAHTLESDPAKANH